MGKKEVTYGSNNSLVAEPRAQPEQNLDLGHSCSSFCLQTSLSARGAGMGISLTGPKSASSEKMPPQTRSLQSCSA